MTAKHPGMCVLCDKHADDLCNDQVCRACHKAESFEDCIADKQVNAIRRKAGLPEVER